MRNKQRLFTVIGSIALLIPSVVLAVQLTGSVRFQGDLSIVGSLSKGSGTFVIDHPIDPANKLLYHSFVESPDMKNLYSGNTTLNEHGEVTVDLPLYYDALNKDARYQFFPLGEAMPNLHVKTEEGNNRFVIAGGTPGGRISWQITGIRHDPYARLHPVVTEVEKGPDQFVDKGECIYELLCQ